MTQDLNDHGTAEMIAAAEMGWMYEQRDDEREAGLHACQTHCQHD